MPPLPAILYGTAWKKERTAALVELALDCGFRGIDTACQPKHYHEAGVGDGIAAACGRGLPREALYLQTKFTPLAGQDPHQVPYSATAPLAEQVAESVAMSLRNLKTSYLDALVLHSPLPTFVQTLEVWRAFEEFVDRGVLRDLGISNCAKPALQALYREARIKPTLVQNRFYKATAYDREVREFCRMHGIHYQSFWTLTANPHLLQHRTMTRLAQYYHRTPAQIFFRYLTQRAIVPLTGTASAAHMREALAIAEFDLSRDECRKLDTLL